MHYYEELREREYEAADEWKYQVERELNCVHHWVIEPNERPVSVGRCKYCTQVRLFKNWDASHDFILNTEAKIGC